MQTLTDWIRSILILYFLMMIILYFIILKINRHLEEIEKRSAAKFVS